METALTKKCSVCGQDKPLTDFHIRKRKSGRVGTVSHCKACHYARAKDWANRNKDKQRGYLDKYKKSEKGQATEKRAYDKRLPKIAEMNRLSRLKALGISKEEYDKRFAEQNGLCAICGKLEKRKTKYDKVAALILDHNHQTGQVRGLLCHGCNAALGFVLENAETVQSMLAYIKKWTEESKQSATGT